MGYQFAMEFIRLLYTIQAFNSFSDLSPTFASKFLSIATGGTEIRGG